MPRQELALDHFETCRSERNIVGVRIRRLAPEGRIGITGRHLFVNEMKRCLTEKYGYHWR